MEDDPESSTSRVYWDPFREMKQERLAGNLPDVTPPDVGQPMAGPGADHQPADAPGESMPHAVPLPSRERKREALNELAAAARAAASQPGRVLAYATPGERTPLWERWFGAAAVALVEHCLVFGFYAAGLDGGRSARLCTLASLCFWAGMAVLYFRRPQAPADGNLLYGYLAYPVLIVLVSIIAGIVQ